MIRINGIPMIEYVRQQPLTEAQRIANQRNGQRLTHAWSKLKDYP